MSFSPSDPLSYKRARLHGLLLIGWLGPLGRRVHASSHATALFILGVVVSSVFDAKLWTLGGDCIWDS